MRPILPFLLLAALTCAAPAAATKRPNFVIFLADDLGWGDLGVQGHPVIQTPNLDAFARQGVRLSQCYAASAVCSPSRSAILTGRTPYRNGVFTWIPEGRDVHLRTSEIALPRLLRAQGYATCHVGKWHLNSHFNQPTQPQPGDHGYDWWLATQNNAAPSHENPVNFVRNGTPVGRLADHERRRVILEAVPSLGLDPRAALSDQVGPRVPRALPAAHRRGAARAPRERHAAGPCLRDAHEGAR